MGNSKARAVYEANLPDNFRRPQTDSSLEQFIRAKYEAKKYIAREWVEPPLPPTPNWDLELEKQLRKKKEKKVSLMINFLNILNLKPIIFKIQKDFKDYNFYYLTLIKMIV